MYAILSPGETANTSDQLLGIIADVVMLAVGLAPNATWQWPNDAATRTIVVVAPNAVVAAVVFPTVAT
jgi:hypothetical protein